MSKQRQLEEALFLAERNEFEGVIINEKQSLSDIPEGYRGQVLEVNDHGNVTLWNAFANGNLHEVASRV